MDVAAHQFSDGSIDHSMALADGEPGERGGGDDDVEMPALAGSRMTGVRRTVIADFQQRGRERRLQRGAQAIDASAHGDFPAAGSRMIHSTRPSVKTKSKGTTTQVLKVTQVASLMV